MIIKPGKDTLFSIPAIIVSTIMIIIVFVKQEFETKYIILMGSIMLYATITHWIAFGKTIILDEEGYRIKLWKIEKYYRWDEIKTKRIEGFMEGSGVRYYKPIRSVLKGAVFSKNKIYKAGRGNAERYCSYIHPFSVCYFYLVPGKAKEFTRMKEEIGYVVAEEEFIELMERGNINFEDCIKK